MTRDAPPGADEGRRAPKAVRDGYAPAPFFFPARSGGVESVVAWTDDLAQLRRVIERVLDGFPNDLRVQMKVRSDQGVDGWIHWDGECDLPTVRRAIAAHEECVLQDGESQLTIERLDNGERLTLDDVGVLHLHADPAAMERACAETGFEKRREELIGRGGCWRRGVAGEVRQQLIAALRLELGRREEPADDAKIRRRQRAARFATSLWGTIGGLLLGLGTNDVVRGVRGRGVGVLAVVAVATGALLILAAVRGGLAQIRRELRESAKG